MKRSLRVFEGNALFFGKGIWLKVGCNYAGCFYIFSFEVTSLLRIAFIKHLSSFTRLPKYEFNLRLGKREIISTARAQHQLIADWCAEDQEKRRKKALVAQEVLGKAGLLDEAEDYQHGSYLLRKEIK